MNRNCISGPITVLLVLIFTFFTSCTKHKKDTFTSPAAKAADTTKAVLPTHQDGYVWLHELTEIPYNTDKEGYDTFHHPKLTIDIKQNVLVINGKYRFRFTRKKVSTDKFFGNDTTLRLFITEAFKAEKVDISQTTPCLMFEKYTDHGFRLDNLTYKGMLIGTDKKVCMFYRHIYPIMFKRLHVKDRSLVNATYAAAVKPDNVRFPADKERDITIILPALYRNEPVSKYTHMKNETWYDFYQNRKKQFLLSKARIKISKEYDNCAGVYGAQITSSRKSIFLIQGIKPRQQQLFTLKNFPSLVYPGDVQVFNFGGETYELSASGDCTSYFIDNWGGVSNYKLYLAKAGSPYKQLLAAVPLFEATRPDIVWIGDMDGDKKPDFVLDLSTNYEEETKVLLLSSKAVSHNFVQCVGYSSYQFDC